MSTQSLPPFQMVAAKQTEASPPKAISSQFIRIKYDLAKCVQALPEMSHDELLQANAAVGGFTWLEHPSEDIYS
ncbi:MAG: hypothetical protein LV480_12165 [Methylacidiphilales bacterium]|nr:hypothetical protein [Candidatus Methylacidiphilales bacterium]